jgi:hypothetical protein
LKSFVWENSGEIEDKMDFIYISAIIFLSSLLFIYSSWKMKAYETVYFRLIVLCSMIGACTIALQFFIDPLPRLYALAFLFFIFVLQSLFSLLDLLQKYQEIKYKQPNRAPSLGPRGLDFRKISILVAILLLLSPVIKNWDLVSDYPGMLQGRFASVSGQASCVCVKRSTFSTQVEIRTGQGDMLFKAGTLDFETIIEGHDYTVVYLPNSMYVIDISDAGGK